MYFHLITLYLIPDDPLPTVSAVGMAYGLDETERSATMSRIETKKMKEKKNHAYLSALPASSEELLEGASACERCLLFLLPVFSSLHSC